MPRRPPLVIGHRGAPGYRPEHTRSSYELAIAQGADAVEPDVVVSRDGVLVVRHDWVLGRTTDIARRPEFAARRTTKVLNGDILDDWFVEDFDWGELATLRAREPLPRLRPGGAASDGTEPILRLRDVLDLARDAAGGEAGVVVELKDATRAAGLGWDLAALTAAELDAAGWGRADRRLVIESFEPGVLQRMLAGGLPARYVFLLSRWGGPPDDDRDYAWFASPAGLDWIVARFDGISVDRRTILRSDGAGVVGDAHDRGLDVFAWTCRAENAFLLPAFREGDDRSAFGDYAGEWALLRDAGVDGVFVDQPDLGVEVFRRVTPG